MLVVALLGHGMASGTGLHFMAGDSLAEAPLTAVDVGSLLTQALDTQGLAGVIAIVDTCHAGNAVPDLKSVAIGIRQGDTRLSLLMGSGAAEEAYGLRFSRTLVRVLREGCPRRARRWRRRPWWRPCAATAARRGRRSCGPSSTGRVSHPVRCGWPATPGTRPPARCWAASGRRNWPGWSRRSAGRRPPDR